MKDFDKIRIVGCIMMHTDDKWAKMVLADLCKYIDELYINLNEASLFIDKLCRNYPKLKNLIVTDNKGKRWNQTSQREKTLRMLDNVKPDLVIFPDSDETFPPEMPEILKAFWESEYNCLWFNMLYLWNNEKTMRRDKLWKAMHHVRAFKWKPDLTYLPHSGYGARPSNYAKDGNGYKFHSWQPLKHYGYMTLEDRMKKMGRWNANKKQAAANAADTKGIILNPVPY